MKFPSDEFDAAVADICHATANQEVVTELSQLLAENKDARKEYIWRLELHGYLGSNYKRQVAAEEESTSEEEDEAFQLSLASASKTIQSHSRHRTSRRTSIWRPFFSAAAMIAIAATALWWLQQPGTQNPQVTIGQIAALDEVTWVKPELQLEVGDQIYAKARIELTSGSAKIRFDSGAELELTGPSILEPISNNSAFLTLGHASVIAETPTSKGFTLVTPTSRFVDIGTKFTVWATPDGFNRLQVLDGDVDVFSDETLAPKRVTANQSLLIEPGNKKILTTLEAGDETEDFNFPTIESPSDRDYADASHGHASVAIFGTEVPHQRSSGPSSLLNGQTSTADKPFHFGMSGNGFVMMDLGKKIAISKINCYSWFRNNRTRGRRAKQVYTLYGFLGGPSHEEPLVDAEIPLESLGWVTIARIQSNKHFQGSSPFQQVSSITASDGEIGQYRYLLWHIHGRTPYMEFDVYE